MNRNIKRNNIYNINIRNNGIFSTKKQLNDNIIREKQNDQNYFRKNDSNLCLNKRRLDTISSSKIENSYYDNDFENENESIMYKFRKYISYIICCKKNNPKISYIESFRAKLISEENILQIYVDLFKILQMNVIQKKSIFDIDND